MKDAKISTFFECPVRLKKPFSFQSWEACALKALPDRVWNHHFVVKKEI
jgi:hypothetical protein